MSSTDQRKFFSEVIALDAWHSPISKNDNDTEVRVEISFKSGRLGGDDSEFEYTFRVALRNANLRVKVEQPLKIARETIHRNVPELEAELTKYKEVREDVEKSRALGVEINAKDFASALSGNVKKN